VHLAYIWIVCHLSAKNYQNRWKFVAVLTKTNLLSFFGTRCSKEYENLLVDLERHRQKLIISEQNLLWQFFCQICV